jgi:hypothetical protein
MPETNLVATESVLSGDESDPGSSASTPKTAGRQHFAVRLPTVNLLSPAVLEELALGRLRRRFALVAIGLVVLLGAGWAVQTIRVAHAEEELGAQQTRMASLTAQVNALAPIRRFYAAVAQQKDTVTHTMASEILFSRVMAELRARAPSGVLVETMSVEIQPFSGPTDAAGGGTPEDAPSGAASKAAPTATAPIGTACPTPEPFAAAPTLGCITIGGSAVNREAIGSLVTRLGESDLFVGPFISASNVSGEGRVVFTGTVGVTDKVFSGRYADLGWMTAMRGAQ